MKEMAATVESLKTSEHFFSFDIFMLWKMGFLQKDIMYTAHITEQMRMDAYHECMKRIGVNRVAAVQTIQKWFGIHGKGTPGREAVFRLAFALHLSCEEAEGYLVSGIGETGFQINDYREVVFLYSLRKGISYEEALCIIDEVEGRLPQEMQMLAHNDTNKLWDAFREKSGLDKEDFISWVVSKGSYFKGYSMTVLNYLRTLKQEVISGVKCDVRKSLELLLAETNFYQWERERRYEEGKRSVTVPKFFREASRGNEESVSEAMEKCILELLKVLEIPTDSNQEFLQEFYAAVAMQKSIQKEKRKEAKKLGWYLFDNKYLSELLNIGSQKEKQVNLLLLKRRAEAVGKKRRCPKELLVQARSCGYAGGGKISPRQLVEWAEMELLYLGKRIHMVQRRDLLQMIAAVAQLRYLHQMEEKGEVYSAQKGRKLFVQLADTILTACCMERLNREKYKLDALFLSCYQEEEMYSVSELLEII